MPRLVPLLLVMLIALAGCTGTPGGNPTATDANDASTATPTGEPVGTPTPTSSPTPTPSIPDGRLAPGVTDDGIENVSALVGAHANVLGERGFELLVERTVTTANRTYATERLLVVAPHLRRMRANATTTLSGNQTRRQSWLDASMVRMLTRIESGDEIRYRVPPIGPEGGEGRERHLSRLIQTRRLPRLLHGGEFDVTGVNRSDGTRRYALVAQNASGSERYGEREVHLSVSPEGVIHALKVVGETAEGHRFTFGYHLREVGIESVERPAWVADAPEPVDSRPTLGFQNCTKPYLVLENPGPDALPNGTVVRVTLNGTEYRATLEAALPAGEARALYVDPSGEMRTAPLDAVPVDRTALPTDAQFTVSTGEGMLLTSGAIGFGCATASEGGSGSSAAD